MSSASFDVRPVLKAEGRFDQGRTSWKEELLAMTVVRELAEQLDPSMVVASGSAYED
jgi:hypothetical protein